MDLWIRSQDKTNLIKVYDVYVAERSKIRANFQKGYGCAYTELGEYATEERALEVLDEIHGCIQTNAGFEMYSNLGQFSDDFNKKYNLVPVYLMPKE
jgi:hypothetical protein